jgi:putative oxidoreductase
MPSCSYAFRSGCSSPFPGKQIVCRRRGTKPVYDTLVKAKIPFPRQTAYFVAGVEFVCGSLLALGFLSSMISVALLIDMIVATLTEAISTLPK